MNKVQDWDWDTTLYSNWTQFQNFNFMIVIWHMCLAIWNINLTFFQKVTFSWNQLLFCQNSVQKFDDNMIFLIREVEEKIVLMVLAYFFFKNVSIIWNKKADDHWILQDIILQHRILITKAVDLYWRKEKIQGVKAISGKRFKLTFIVSTV